MDVTFTWLDGRQKYALSQVEPREGIRMLTGEAPFQIVDGKVDGHANADHRRTSGTFRALNHHHGETDGRCA